MTEQLDTNAGATAKADETQQPMWFSASIDSMADAMANLFDSTLKELVAIRDSRYAAAIEDLEHELGVLAKEYEQLEKDIASLESVIPSKERLTQHEVDELLLSGAKQDAANRRTELAEFKSKPVVMRGRLGVIHDRFQSIDQEKKDIARDIFNEWYSNAVQPTIRAAEHGLLITLLEGLSNDMYQFQVRVGMGTSDNRHRPLLNQGYITGLTADGRSAEWAAGHKWYG